MTPHPEPEDRYQPLPREPDLRPVPTAVWPFGAVTAARGFSASGLHCGIRYKRRDLALLACDGPASAAGVFTTNLFQAAPLVVTREHLATAGGITRAVVVNSGNANACTCPAGLAAARRTAAEAARLLNVPSAQVLVASTGLIGEPLPLDRLLAGLRPAVAALSPSGGAAAAEAILTTDTCTKEAVRRVRRPTGSYMLGGMAKGSGMIHPNMATTLGFITTDAAVPPPVLSRCLRSAAQRSFNRISVDGDTSTNDMVLVLASGASPVAVASAQEIEAFETALTELMVDLARQVARDGEGASRLITIEVAGAASEDDAVAVARTVAGSLLVKTAVHGSDPNWGRIAAAAGRAGVALDPDRLRIAVGPIALFAAGAPLPFSERAASRELDREEVLLHLDLGQGDAAARVWTCDLTDGYIRINASYRT